MIGTDLGPVSEAFAQTAGAFSPNAFITIAADGIKDITTPLSDAGDVAA